MIPLREKSSPLWRERKIIQASDSPFVNFSSNDYFSLSQHPEVIQAVRDGLDETGLGSTGSPLLSGYSKYHFDIEELFCQKLGFENALLYPSGYQANIGVLSTLLDAKSIVLADRSVHASIIDGIRLSGAKLIRFAHNDIDHFTRLAKKNKPNLVIAESIYSMQGDIAPLKSISSLCADFSIPLMVDDAHGFGILGDSGLGATDHWEFKNCGPDILTIPFGKALGVSGCIVLSSLDIIETLIQKSRSYCYSTSLSPLFCKAVKKSLSLIIGGNILRKTLRNLAQYLNLKSMEKGLPLLNRENTPIRSFHVGESSKSSRISKTLQQNGFHVANIRPPTVSKHHSLLRVSLNVAHQHKDIDRLLFCLSENL